MLDHRSSSVTKLHTHKYEYSDSEKENLSLTTNTNKKTDDKDASTTEHQEHSLEQDTQNEAQQNGGYVWRLSSGLVNSTTGVISGAFGLGFGGVKWVASKGYSAGEVVVDTTKNIVCKVPVPALRRKDKKE